MDFAIGILLISAVAGIAWLVFTGPPVSSAEQEFEHLRDVSINICTFQQIHRIAEVLCLTDKEEDADGS